MRDLLFLALALGFFAAAGGFVVGCERIVGRTTAAVEHER